MCIRDSNYTDSRSTRLFGASVSRYAPEPVRPARLRKDYAVTELLRRGRVRSGERNGAFTHTRRAGMGWDGLCIAM